VDNGLILSDGQYVNRKRPASQLEEKEIPDLRLISLDPNLEVLMSSHKAPGLADISMN
jgi:hypothetical protein